MRWLPIFYLFFHLAFVAVAENSVRENPVYYIVEPGDTLYEIAADFGNKYSWVEIYQTNDQKIIDPDLIYPGQKLKIPSSLVTPKTESVKKDSSVVMSESDSLKTTNPNNQKKQALQAFRKAFSAVVDKKQNKEKAGKERSKDKQQQEGLGLGGMVLDETRTKMGRDFYSTFYKHWEAPTKAQNFTIIISEQPVPSRGTMVKIEINDQLVFRNRLEPRYYKTKKKARQAVSICQRKLLRLAGNQNELAGY